ncbi:MAG: TPM domain-containing protein [Roseburia sp.]|nr:TPM domain-containing protein [Roseburia sp.]MCM1242902.1 TPM domain-containing protein [Roseburia sp.]
MREYLKAFRWVYAAVAVMLLLLLSINGVHAVTAKMRYYDRTNTECSTTQRVFDYADVLSDKEEQKLASLIDKRQKQTGCDIVLITMNESLKEYAREIEPGVSYDEFVRVFAEQFYEENNFGYDKANGDGVLLVDNWYREDDGRIYTWFCTTGIVKDTYSNADIDHILDRVYQYVETNPYKAYKRYVNDFYDDMLGTRVFHVDVPRVLYFLPGIIATVIFIAVNWQSRKGEKTTTAVTYLNGGREEFTNRQDIFIRKSVVKHHIERSSGGGGHGGGHSGGGGGGGSHGGGGHSR